MRWVDMEEDQWDWASLSWLGSALSPCFSERDKFKRGDCKGLETTLVAAGGLGMRDRCWKAFWETDGEANTRLYPHWQGSLGSITAYQDEPFLPNLSNRSPASGPSLALRSLTRRLWWPCPSPTRSPMLVRLWCIAFLRVHEFGSGEYFFGKTRRRKQTPIKWIGVK